MKANVQKRGVQLCVMVTASVLLVFPSFAWNPIDSLQNWVKELLTSGINAMFGFIGSILLYALDTSGGELRPGEMIEAHPATWQSGSVWTVVRDISNHAIVPIALLVLMIVLVNELIQLMTAGNQFESAGIAPFVKWAIKAFVGIVLVANIFNIAAAVFTLGVAAGSNGIATGINQSIDVAAFDGLFNAADLDIPILIAVLLLTIITFLLVCLLLVSILIVLAGRMIEVFMYLSVAPLTTATFMNSEWRSVGASWFKGLAALAFQGFFIVIAIAIFTRIFTNIVNLMSSQAADVGGLDLIFRMLILVAYTLALTMTVFRSGSISKAVFGAH